MYILYIVKKCYNSCYTNDYPALTSVYFMYIGEYYTVFMHKIKKLDIL